MKHLDTYILSDPSGFSQGEGWREVWTAYNGCILDMENPIGSGSFTIRKRTKKLDKRGNPTKQVNRNKVPAIKNQFKDRLEQVMWETERNLSLDDYLNDPANSKPIITYPSGLSLKNRNTSFGPFDFWYRTTNGLKAVIEWETGNVSSSHRSLNKLCLALASEKVDIAVLIVPSSLMYPHLTDRIGNWRELQPYLSFWQEVVSRLPSGLLAISVVEHDVLTTDPSFPYIEGGNDGRAAEGAAKLL